VKRSRKISGKRRPDAAGSVPRRGTPKWTSDRRERAGGHFRPLLLERRDDRGPNRTSRLPGRHRHRSAPRDAKTSCWTVMSDFPPVRIGANRPTLFLPEPAYRLDQRMGCQCRHALGHASWRRAYRAPRAKSGPGHDSRPQIGDLASFKVDANRRGRSRPRSAKQPSKATASRSKAGFPLH